MEDFIRIIEYITKIALWVILVVSTAMLVKNLSMYIGWVDTEYSPGHLIFKMVIDVAGMAYGYYKLRNPDPSIDDDNDDDYEIDDDGLAHG